MRVYFGSVTALCLATGTAYAGGIERSPQSVGPLFEEGRYVEFSFATVSPDVSGVGGLITPGVASGDMTETYQQYGFAYKADLNDTLSYALIYDQPYGANVNYPTGTGYFAQGSLAEFDSNALTAILQYNFPSKLSVYGGLRYQYIDANAFVPFVTGGGPLAGTPYEANAEKDGGAGYLLGVAYERPEIALRVALTYQSTIKHELDTTESSVLGLNVTSTTEIETPQSLTLDFQSGVAEDTLVFGSIRWVDWSAFEIAPESYVGLVGSPLVFYADDRIKYTLGVGRRLNENWSVAASVNYERTTGSPTGNLGPTDGQLGLGLSAVYTVDNMKITGGISYTDIGEANTIVGAAIPGGVFTDNDAVAVGFKIGYYF
ncbi:OmpP1/FadL family transporter [Roseobacter ponti]|uniref:Uncharacterized protein n=1 Tax=Roseobacter ponti TaxID=1891787 RepID=A0A858SUG4_9RHOB|nr:outer membrane protein transport protein [Roseobacter ponti]QJF51333.1 hypothetical protein G3256_09245 [Roseobacter ponti]